MADVAENRADQDNHHGGDLRGHSCQLYEDGQQDQTKSKTEKVCAGKAYIFSKGRPSLLRRLEGEMLMRKKGVRNSQDLADYARRHIGHKVWR